MDMTVEKEVHRLAALAASRIHDAMDESGLSNSELAARVGVPPSRVTKVLYGDANFTLKTMIQFGLACGIIWGLQPIKVQKASHKLVRTAISTTTAPASTITVEAGASTLFSR